MLSTLHVDMPPQSRAHPTPTTAISESIMERYSFEGSEAVHFPAPGVCDWCHSEKAKEGGEKLKKCSGCSAVLYCSRECQIKAWPKHK